MKTTRGVIYARYSPGPNQTEQSIEGQVSDCTQFAEEKGINITHIYIDRAVSGKESENRSEFQRMLRDAANGLFDCCIVWKIDRFGRNREEIALNKVKLKKHGISLLYAQEHIPDGPEGIILESVLEGMAEYYSADLAQKIKRGYRECAKKGQVFGYACYGYDRIDKKLCVNASEAKVVRQIFTMYADGSTSTEISKVLTANGIFNRRGTSFNPSYILKLLRNKTYIGIREYDGIEIFVEPIISMEVWNKVQERLRKNKSKPGPWRPEQYLLSGKAFCGYDQGLLVGISGTSKTGKLYHYYACSNKRNKKVPCDLKNVSQEWLDQFVVDHTVNDVLTDTLIDRLADCVVDIYNSSNSDSVVNELKSQLRDVNKKLNALVDALEQGIYSSTTKERLDMLEAQKNQLEYQIECENIKKPNLDRDKIHYWLSMFKSGNVKDELFQARLVNMFIHSVYVWNEKVAIVYNFSDGSSSEYYTEDIGVRIDTPLVD